MIERRRAERMSVQMMVTQDAGGDCRPCQAHDLSPTGIRLQRRSAAGDPPPVINIEIPLVPGGLTTAIAARRVWQSPTQEAYEFVDPSFAQQAMLERVFGNF